MKLTIPLHPHLKIIQRFKVNYNLSLSISSMLQIPNLCHYFSEFLFIILPMSHKLLNKILPSNDCTYLHMHVYLCKCICAFQLEIILDIIFLYFFKWNKVKFYLHFCIKNSTKIFDTFQFKFPFLKALTVYVILDTIFNEMCACCYFMLLK